jgi:hypothetical protein
MALTKSLIQIALDDLQSVVCFCGAKKAAKQSFCRACYFALPASLRSQLYKHISDGYAEIYDEAKTFIQCETNRKEKP